MKINIVHQIQTESRNVMKYQLNDDKKISLENNRMVSFRIFGQLGVKEAKLGLVKLLLRRRIGTI